MRPALGALVLLSLLLVANLLPAVASADEAGDQCFPETGHCLGGRFRAYWEQHGGLEVFGFPITPARPEPNPDTGQTHLVQWFERHRFELHEQNPPPYDVQLGRVGHDRLRQLDVDWQALPRPGQLSGDCLWFEQTGHNLCDLGASGNFKSYWLRHGLNEPDLDDSGRSLALFGLPLSEPRLETGPTGETVLRQWFERARFEFRPYSRTPVVQLGLLGREVHATAHLPLVRRPASEIVLGLSDLPPGYRVEQQDWTDRQQTAYARTFVKEPFNKKTDLYGIASMAVVFPARPEPVPAAMLDALIDGMVNDLARQYGGTPQPVAGVGDRALLVRVAAKDDKGKKVYAGFIAFRRLNVIGILAASAYFELKDTAQLQAWAATMASRAAP